MCIWLSMTASIHLDHPRNHSPLSYIHSISVPYDTPIISKFVMCPYNCVLSMVYHHFFVVLQVFVICIRKMHVSLCCEQMYLSFTRIKS